MQNINRLQDLFEIVVGLWLFISPRCLDRSARVPRRSQAGAEARKVLFELPATAMLASASAG